MDGNRARFGFETLPDSKSTSEATKHLNGPITSARMTIPPKIRIRDFPEPKSAIARVQTHRTTKKKPGQKSHQMRNLLLFHVLMYNFFSSCPRKNRCFIPPLSLIRTSSSSSQSHPATAKPSAQACRTKGKRAKREGPIPENAMQ